MDDDAADDEVDENEMLCERRKIVLDMLAPDSAFAIYSPCNADELFYICKLIKIQVATKKNSDCHSQC